jgi:hypothetical protein
MSITGLFKFLESVFPVEHIVSSANNSPGHICGD